MSGRNTVLNIDEYLRERLMPVEGAIPHIPGIEMFGNSIPAGTVGGDLFEYINFQQRYDIDARIQQAQRLAKEFLEPLPRGAAPRSSVDDHVQWLKTTRGYRSEMEAEYRFTRSSEEMRVAEVLRNLYETAGVLLVDAQGHGIISAKIASTVHDTFHALMLTELDRYGRTTPMLFENINLRLAQFLALGLQIPADHPDRGKYYSLNFRQAEFASSNLGEITLMSPGDILLLYTDGFYDGSDKHDRELLEVVMREHYREPAKEICNALLDHAVRQDERLRQSGNADLIDDKTVFIVKRT